MGRFGTEIKFAANVTIEYYLFNLLAISSKVLFNVL